MSDSPLLRSGLAQMQAMEAALPAGKRFAVLAVADENGVRVHGTAAFDTELGRWLLSGELEKLKTQPGVNWQVAVLWSK